MAVLHPEVLWAQRSSESDDSKARLLNFLIRRSDGKRVLQNIVYLTVNLPDINEASLQYTLEPTKVSFKATSGNEKTGATKEYAFDLDLFAEVVPEKSTKRITTRSFAIVLRKAEQKSEYWPRLTKEKVKNAYLKTDFSKWVDEDEQDGEVVKAASDGSGIGGPPGMGMGMPGMGMGGMGGMDFEKMMAEMGQSGAGPSGAGEDDDDSDDDGPPPLEEA
ncbi:HSP20-like chaperone [Mycena amicta]|nr:HSP20-like chaperone [Mycena amicta]